jgi:RNA polymerase sigma factor (sigma-70 family)
MEKKPNNAIFAKTSIQVNIEKGVAKTKETLKNLKFDQLWTAFNKKVKTMLINQFKDEELVEDAIQDGFVKFLVDGLDLEQTNLIGWLHTVVMNKCIDECRKRKRQNNSVSIEKDFEMYKDINKDVLVEQMFSTEEIEAHNWRALFKYEQLPFENALARLKLEHEILWNVVECYYFKDLQHKEIALALHISENMSKRRLLEAKQKLRFFLNVELKNSK